MKSKINIHLNENNEDSQTFLEENEEKMSRQCLQVMQLLNKGMRLTVACAMSHGISSLPRRLLDLKEKNNITNIKDEWVRDGNGKRLYKIWFIEGLRPPTKKQVTKKHQENILQQPLL